jgi:hypothetical protein
VAILVLPALSGCGQVRDRADAASAVAVGLQRAIAGKDGTRACALLAPATAAEVADSAGSPCATAILDEDLPAPGTATRSRVYGQRAQVQLTDDTVFLAVFPGGWRVVAAGCTDQGEQPYDCKLQGS